MTWALTILGGILTFIIFYLYQTSLSIHRDGKSLRRPPNTLPLVGNALHFLKPRHELFSWFVKCQQIFGQETFEISVPSLPPGVVINSPENLEFVLKNEASISKGEFFRERSWDLFGRCKLIFSWRASLPRFSPSDGTVHKATALSTRLAICGRLNGRPG